jgi:predicted phage terminase large subunit-like protein
VRPQPGPQELFLRTPADVAIIGGSLFGGKTWSLVYEPLRNIDVPGFTFVLFRREMPRITNKGGMWDESTKWYPLAGGVPREHTREWTFPSGASGRFAGLQYDKDLEDWKGAQIALIGFDQLEEFTEKQFFYMFSRNRSTCGVRPYIRASCNPDPDSFLASLLAWWIDAEGWALTERSGVIRWLIRVGDDLVWSDVTCGPDEYDAYESREALAKDDLEERHPGHGTHAKSITFVLARLQDNEIGNKADPAYLANVRMLPLVEQQRLLGGDRGGNWKVREVAGKVFNRAGFKTQPAKWAQATRVRYWDKAGTEGGGKFTAGVLMALHADGRVCIEDVVRGQWSAANREPVIKQVAQADGPGVTVWIEQEPGSGGKESADNTILSLRGYAVYADRVSGDKLARANPLAAQALAGNVSLLQGEWNEAFLREAHGFEAKAAYKDQIDAAAGAFNKLTIAGKGGGTLKLRGAH